MAWVSPWASEPSLLASEPSHPSITPAAENWITPHRGVMCMLGKEDNATQGWGAQSPKRSPSLPCALKDPGITLVGVGGHEAGFHCEVEAGLKLATILLPQPPKVRLQFAATIPSTKHYFTTPQLPR